MSTPAIEFCNVSLRYRMLSERGIHSLKEFAIRRLTGQVSYRQLVALSNVSFTVDEGKALGLIGPNGAGKSTLLRIAGGILPPSDGVATVRGRIAPVVELGIGFEGELSGRENIYFNGALLGRSRHVMQERFDEIVDFSELGPFIDSPLRTYSTGMLARLAFAIATTVDAQILLLDEVLAVGDESFRQRCLERIQDFRRRGFTILLVSHDLPAVANICDQAIWLDRGVVRAMGPALETVTAYHVSVHGPQEVAGHVG
jgi:ABC-type polysaccharide/polyol phosphate transport system ATPase subunit